MSNSLKYMSVVLIVGLISACGSTLQEFNPAPHKERAKKPTPTPTATATSQPAQLSPYGFAFAVSSKECGNTPILMAEPEHYVFMQNGDVAKRVVVSDTAQAQCTRVVEFSRSHTIAIPTTAGYLETSQLTENQIKNSCRNKVNGIPVEPSIPGTPEAIPAKPTTYQLSFDLKDSDMAAEIKNSDECPKDLLQLKLSKIPNPASVITE